MKAQELRQLGYKTHKDIKGLYINKNGEVYNLKKKKHLKVFKQKPYVLFNSQYINVAKWVLFLFKEKPIRNGQITFIDGNNNNLSIENIKYTRLFSNEYNVPLKEADLLKAIRCYIQVDEKFDLKDHVVKSLYLKTIIRVLRFIENHKEHEYIEIFDTYVNHNPLQFSNVHMVGEIHKISQRDVGIIVNSFFNLLSSQILRFESKGILKIQPFKSKPKTKTEEIREINEYFVPRGFKPLRLKKRSEKEIFKDFEKLCEEIKNTKRV
ncbi:hypothetical protein [Flammeovirga aprica]|uniref:Uncharacterized protein n=1 Tax=Flammeovirga aprica JL-4 TaxID=694437 RepID=A0A7X9RSZ0_9BACT|nr:hypothetical protein [Flammeovirga aprica]NME66619.1 hypothetical protein [Flammeovirga aprica JL-4]